MQIRKVARVAGMRKREKERESMCLKMGEVRVG